TGSEPIPRILRPALAVAGWPLVFKSVCGFSFVMPPDESPGRLHARLVEEGRLCGKDCGCQAVPARMVRSGRLWKTGPSGSRRVLREIRGLKPPGMSA